MTTVAGPMTGRTVARLRNWLSVPHSLRTEALLVIVLYGAYESARGLVAGDSSGTVASVVELVRDELDLAQLSRSHDA